MRISAAICFVLLLSTSAQAQHPLGEQLQELDRLLQEARAHSTAASEAATIDEVRHHADGVFVTIWGQPSGLADRMGGAAAMHGWKTRWQTTGEEFDENHVARHGNTPPAVDDPTQLGFMGRARFLRRALVQQYEVDPAQQHLQHVIDALNNVIGWMRLDDGVTKAENQPRVDLTYMWDAPSEFWNTSAR